MAAARCTTPPSEPVREREETRPLRARPVTSPSFPFPALRARDGSQQITPAGEFFPGLFCAAAGSASPPGSRSLGSASTQRFARV